MADAIDTTAPHIGSPLEGLGPETIRKIALQSRPLTANESSIINQTFKGSVNPADMRIAYDSGASGTNLRGYVLAKDLPTVMFFPTDLSSGELKPDVIHEATHVWQELTNNRFTGQGVRPKAGTPGADSERARYVYDKESAANRPFTEFGTEQQPEMVAANEKSATAFVQSHKGNRPFLGDMAFLDSVRRRYNQTRPDVADPAKQHALFDKNSFSSVERPGSEGYPQLKTGQYLKPKVSAKGDHNVVLENLRTKFPNYRNVSDGPLLAALLHKHPDYAQHVGPQGLRLALESGHKPSTASAPRPAGMVQAGTVNLNGRPIIQNEDGSHSSEYSISFGTDKGEVLVPTVVNGRFLTPDGKKPREGSAEEKQMFQRAKQHYAQTGQHMGIFDTPEHADAYASQVHSRQMKPTSKTPMYVLPLPQDTPMQPPQPMQDFSRGV